MTYSWNSPNPAFLNPDFGIGTQNFGGDFLGGDVPGLNIGGTASADYSGGVATNAFGGGGGLGSWGGMQALGGIANTVLNQVGNAQGTQAGQAYLDFMADKRDADFGSAFLERNVDIADQFRIPRVVAKMRANDPNIRQADRRADLAQLAGKYGQLGGFLA
jgi:hypothetical protein